MKREWILVVALLLSFSALASAQAQERPWFASIDFGEGQLKLTSDQVKHDTNPTFAFALTGGHRLGQHARAGLLVNGWLLQAFNLNDPTVGESVSNVFGIVDLFPSRKHGLFVRGGGGLSIYTNNHPTASGGHGPGWTAGAGYEFPLYKSVAVAPSVAYAGGSYGDTSLGTIPMETHRRFSVVEFKLAFVVHFGRAK